MHFHDLAQILFDRALLAEGDRQFSTFAKFERFIAKSNSCWHSRSLHNWSRKLSTDNSSTNAFTEALLKSQQRPATGLSLASLWNKPEVRSIYYNGKTIKLDGYRFIECRFDNCVLQVNSENFELIQCVIDSSSRIEYATSITKVIKLFLGRYPWASQFFPSYFLPTKNPNQSETISDQGP